MQPTHDIWRAWQRQDNYTVCEFIDKMIRMWKISTICNLANAEIIALEYIKKYAVVPVETNFEDKSRLDSGLCGESAKSWRLVLGS